MVEDIARPLAKARYRIACLDHDKDDFCVRLAARLLEGRATNLTWREVGQAIRTLRDHQFDDPSMHVERTDKGYWRRRDAEYASWVETAKSQGVRFVEG